MVREDIENIIRQKLLEREWVSAQKESVDMGQYPELMIRWISDQRLQEETIGSTPSEVADSLIRHKMDGELSVCAPDGTEVLIAKGTYVLMARDVEYWKQLNELLCQAVCENAASQSETMRMDVV